MKKDMAPYVKHVAASASAFLLADRVVKQLPPTAFWALGWGTAATAIAYMATSKTGFDTGTSKAVGLGVAFAYLHGYAHQNPYPHKQLPKG